MSTGGKLRLVAAAAVAVAVATGASPAKADSFPPSSSGAGTSLIRLTPQQITPVVRLGESATYVVTVTNVGDDDARLVSAEVFGDNLGLDWKFAEGCFGTVLAPGDTCSYTLTFTPVVAGRVSGAFCITGLAAGSTVGDRECGGIHGVAL